MRFAEVMLNYAETANETGRTGEALDILYQIRQRAGILPGANNQFGITATTREEVRELILAERNIEFSFENKHFWDLRRLRMLDRLHGNVKHGVEAIAINPDGTDMPIAEAWAKGQRFELTEANFRYVTIRVPVVGEYIMSVPDTYYFFPIQSTVIDQNPGIEQNSNWGGTFNPALE
jgi:hypothetical protein